jgi:hypothetical protein
LSGISRLPFGNTLTQEQTLSGPDSLEQHLTRWGELAEDQAFYGTSV